MTPKEFYAKSKIKSALQNKLKELMTDFKSNVPIEQTSTIRLVGSSAEVSRNYSFELVDCGNDVFIGLKQGHSMLKGVSEDEIRQEFGEYCVETEQPVSLVSLQESGVSDLVFKAGTDLVIEELAPILLQTKAAKSTAAEAVEQALQKINDEPTPERRLATVKKQLDAITKELGKVDVEELRNSEDQETYFKKFDYSRRTPAFTSLIDALQDRISLPVSAVLRTNLDLSSTLFEARQAGKTIPDKFQRPETMSLIGSGTKEEVVAKAQRIANGIARDVHLTNVLVQELKDRTSQPKATKKKLL